MAIDKGTRAEILRLYYAEKWKTGTIADQLGVHHSRRPCSVRCRLGKRGGTGAPSSTPRPFIRQTLAVYPKLAASRLYEMARERGYPGSQSHFRRLVARERPRPVRGLSAPQDPSRRAGPGRLGPLRQGEDRSRGAPVDGLRDSSQLLAPHLPALLPRRRDEPSCAAISRPSRRGRACPASSGTTLKSVVAERQGNAIRFNPRFLEFAGYYRFLPKPVAIARGNEKGRVERAIATSATASSPPAPGGIDDLNAQAEAWCNGIAADRPWPEDRSITVRDPSSARATPSSRCPAIPSRPTTGSRSPSARRPTPGSI